MRVVVAQYEGIDATPVLPLAAGCLIASARSDAQLARLSYDIALERQPLDRAAAELGRPDLLGLALYPWNAAYSLAVAEAVRARNPECLIVAGGPSVPRRAEQSAGFFAEHPAVDVMAFGEGELTFREIVRSRLAATSLDHIPGLAIRNHPAASPPPPPPQRIHDLTATASPFLDGTFDELMRRHPARFAMALCETNRGCPFSCTFCDWSLTKRVVEFPIERVHAELDWVVTHGFTHIMLADANFGIRPRDTFIARRLVDLRRRTGAPRSFYFYLTKNNHGRNLETIEILQSGEIGTWVGLAVQDFDDGVLEAVKRDNIQTGESMKLRDICGERGIPTFNELILGLPGQTFHSFARTVATAMPPLPHHDFVLFLCRLIDNSELGHPESRARFGIETRRCRWKTSTPGWDSIVDEFQEVVVATRDMPIEDWRRAYRLSFFASALYNLRLLRVVLRYVAASFPLADYLVLLAAATGHDAHVDTNSVYAEIGAAFDRYLASLLASGPFVLPFDEQPDEASTPLTIDEAVAAIALRRYDRFLAETEAITRQAMPAVALPALAEAFRYQSLITPRHNRPEPVEAHFAHDWPAYIAAGGSGATLAATPVRVRFTPGAHAHPSSGAAAFRAFVSSQFACVRGRLEPGRLEVLDRNRPPFAILTGPAAAVAQSSLP